MLTRQHFVGTIAVDTMRIALAAIGLLDPPLAAFIHVASEMTFIRNSARLLPRVETATAGTKVESSLSNLREAD
jgi:Cu+-exporting ATPase